MVPQVVTKRERVQWVWHSIALFRINQYPRFMNHRPSPFEFDDFRDLMHAFIQHLKETKSYSIRKLAQEIEFKSHSLLLMILNGKRRLKPEVARKISAAFRLNANEENYFLSLSEYNQCQEPNRKRELFEKLIALRTEQKPDVRVIDQYEFYLRWYNVVIYEYLPVDFEALDIEELVQELDLEEEEIEASLQLLERLNLAERRDELYKKREFALETHPEANNFLIQQFHASMIEKAKEAVETLPPEKRDASCLTVSMSPETYSTVVERVRQFRSDLNDLLSNTPKRETVYQINFQIYPVLTPTNEEID